MVLQKKSAAEVNPGRFRRRLAYISHEQDCWIWNGSFFKRTNNQGWVKKIPVMPFRKSDNSESTAYARRYSWELQNGPVPEGLQIINVCGEDMCVSPFPAHNQALPPGAHPRTVNPNRAVEPKVFYQGKSGRQMTDFELEEELRKRGRKSYKI